MRLFVAVNIPEDIKEQISEMQSRLKKAHCDVNWVECAKFHLTLKFLGEVEDKDILSISESVARSVSGFGKFEVRVSGTGGFPSAERPKVIWAGIREGKTELERLAANLENGLEKLGFIKEERPFSAHLTLGRVRSFKNIAALSEKLAALENAGAGSFTVESVDLMQSLLRAEGPEYIVLRKFNVCFISPLYSQRG
jgi:2'-5' RNA ligase